MTSRTLNSLLLLIALLAIVTPILLIHLAPLAPRVNDRIAAKLPPRRIVPEADLPPVEPVALADLSPDDARAYNEAQPFADGPIPAAAPFRFAGGVDDLARATDCLATALIYEIGDDPAGEKAIAQVVLNRLRHPAFPKTVCGVVFQGSERRTGCQFSFTCDGALDRWHPLPATTARARTIAARALAGAVYRPVGLATHYHTDRVVPYWQSSLDKIARVGPHLFFRWTGWWGTPPAFGRHPDGAEPVMAALAPADYSDVQAVAGVVTITRQPFEPVAGDPDSFLVTLPTGLAPPLWPEQAARACADRPRCRFSAWIDGAGTPTTLPLAPERIATMAFSYLRDRPAGLERTLWNCARTPRPDRGQCMKVQPLIPTPLATLTPAAAQTPAAVPDLTGIRRKGNPEPASSPTPAKAGAQSR